MIVPWTSPAPWEPSPVPPGTAAHGHLLPSAGTWRDMVLIWVMAHPALGAGA